MNEAGVSLVILLTIPLTFVIGVLTDSPNQRLIYKGTLYALWLVLFCLILGLGSLIGGS